MMANNSTKYLTHDGLAYLIGKFKKLVSDVAGGMVSNIVYNKDINTISKTIGTATTDIIGSATTSMGGLMTSDMVVKLNSIDSGANKIIIDNALSSSSSNAVQNKVVFAALAQKVSGTTTINGKQLTNNITISSSDIPVVDKLFSSVDDMLGYLILNKVEKSTTVNGKSLSESIILYGSDIEISSGAGETVYEAFVRISSDVNGKIDGSTTINGQQLSSNIVLTGSNISVSSEDSTLVSEAIQSLRELIGDGAGHSSIAARVATLESRSYVYLDGTQFITGAKTFSGTLSASNSNNTSGLSAKLFTPPTGMEFPMMDIVESRYVVTKAALQTSLKNAVNYILGADNLSNYYTKSDTDEAISSALSGFSDFNIKTLNGEELVGEGDIEIHGVHVGDAPSQHDALWVDLDDEEASDYYGVHVGESAPIDEHVELWIDPTNDSEQAPEYANIARSHTFNMKDATAVESTGVYNPVMRCIGFTTEETILDLGEVDFGDGDIFNSASVDFAFDGDTDGYVILTAGKSLHSSVPFTQIQLNETGACGNFYRYASNMYYKIEAEKKRAEELKEVAISGLTGLMTDLAPVIEGIDLSLFFPNKAADHLSFVRPKGVNRVFLMFINGQGNIKGVKLHSMSLCGNDLIDDNTSYDYNIRMKLPCEESYYENRAMYKYSHNSVLVSGGTWETRLDPDTDPKEWGWTQGGVVVSYGSFDFENGDYDQVILYLRHGEENVKDILQVFISDVSNFSESTATLVNELFVGYNLGSKVVKAFAKNLSQKIYGNKYVFVKWKEGAGSINLQKVEFCKGFLWEESQDVDMQ